jgi:hypothetical protein
VVVNPLLLLIQVMLLFYHLCRTGFVSFFCGRPLGFGVTSTDAAAASDAAAAAPNTASFFLGTFVRIECPILLPLSLLLLLLIIIYDK